VIHGWSFASYWLGILFARLTGTPIFLRVESPRNQEVMKSGLRFTLKKLFFRYFFFPLVSRFLYIGEENRLFYKYYGVTDAKLFFTPYAVDNEKLLGLTAGTDKASLKKAIGVREDATLILMTGKLVEKKRPFDLLEAFQKIQNPQTTLMFVGDGWLRPRLEERVHAEGMSNVLFVGFKNQEELPRYYAAADIFVLPSEQGETWGLVVNEALCFGLPVIVSDLVGSAKDLVRHGENGYIFKAHDCLALANYLTELIGDAEKRRLFGKKSQERIRSYSFAHDVSGLKAALHSLPHP
jgi:glycosyltransferase involved in cell wall biosynthesis